MYPKPKTPKYPKYLEWLKTQPCVITGIESNSAIDVVPAHQNLGEGYMGGKPSDFYALPLRADLHQQQEHQKGNKTFWKNIDKKKLIIDHLSRFILETMGDGHTKGIKP